MSIKSVFQKLTGKESSPPSASTESTNELSIPSDAFPILRAEDVDLNRYRQLPLDSLATLGVAFASLPASARTITQTVTTQLKLNQPLFLGFVPSGATGFLKLNEYGTSGNIFHIDENGRHTFFKRMRFKPIDTLPQQKTTQTIMPFDPTSMLIAASLLRLEQKLSQLQKSVDSVMQFLSLDKQSKQRGNLNALSEILEEYKRNPTDEKRCALRNVDVQAIRREAQQNLIFYQEQMASRFRQGQVIHHSRQTNELAAEIINDFREYQLACYLYGYSCYLDVLLRQDFREEELHAVASKMETYRQRYSELFRKCRAQLLQHHRVSLDARFLDALGNVVTAAGQTLSAHASLQDSFLNKVVSSAESSLENHQHEAVKRLAEQLRPLADNRITPFIEQLHTLDMLHHQENSLLTDGQSLYLLDML